MWMKSGLNGPGGAGGASVLGDPVIGAGSYVQLEQGPNTGIGFVHPEAPIGEIWTVIQEIAQQTAIANGLSAHSLTAKPVNESGISKIVSNQELMEKRRDDIELWRRYEGQLFDLIKIVNNAHNVVKFSDRAQLRVDFADLRDPNQETDDGLKWQGLIDAGQASPIDWCIARNPDLDRESAKEYLRQVRQEMAEFNATDEPVFDFDK